MFCVLLSLHSGIFHIFFYQGSLATADVHENIVLRFAHADFNNGVFADPRDYQFNVRDIGYDQSSVCCRTTLDQYFHLLL